MAKGKLDSNWKKKVLEWKTSGKTSTAWCKENQIPLTTLCGWKKRLNHHNKKQSFKPHKPFIELANTPSLNSGIFLEYNDVKIHLEPKFNEEVLKQCLACLRGEIC